MPTEAAVLDALSGVRDPELDEPITDLKFISDLRVEEDAVDIQLRLPTPFCAPNFAYLMVADAKEAVLSVPGVREARVTLDDHHASPEINAGMAGEQGFEGTFPGETEGDSLDELRETFRRKSFVARQERSVSGGSWLRVMPPRNWRECGSRTFPLPRRKRST